MVGRKPRQRRTRQRKIQRLMGSHNRSWLWGRHVVLETLNAQRWPIVELALAEHTADEEREAIIALAADREIPIQFVTSDRLQQLCGAADHQGFIAKMRPYPYATIDELLEQASSSPAFCLLDGIQDPHNYGAILRSADVLGIDGVIVAKKGQSDVTAIVARSSAGAVNHVCLAQSDDLSATAQQLHDDHSVRLIAADHRAKTSPADIDWTQPCAIVIGNEGAGVSAALLERCDATIRIPQVGTTESLNAAVAAGILFYEIRRQRDSR